MLQLPQQTVRRFDAAMAVAEVGLPERGYYRKWLRYYLDFCEKYGWPPAEERSLVPFLDKLASKNQSAAQRRQAEQAVRLYLAMPGGPRQIAGWEGGAGQQSPPNTGDTTRDVRPGPAAREGPCAGPLHRADAGPAASPPGHSPRTPESGGDLAARPGVPPVGGGAPGTGASWVKELDALRDAIRLRNYSPRTSESYMHWARKFWTYTRGKPPSQLSTEDVKGFLTALAVRQNVAASTQNQAFNALLFFFRHVLGREFGKVEGVVRAKRRRYIPVVLSRAEIDRVVAHLEPPFDLDPKTLDGQQP